MPTVKDDIKSRLERAAASIANAARSDRGLLQRPRDLYIEVVMAIHELEGVLMLLRRRVLPRARRDDGDQGKR
jgi:hypothetical protein